MTAVVLRVLLLVPIAALAPCVAEAAAQEQGRTAAHENGRAATTAKFLAGAAIGLAAHEGAHLLFDGIFDADPRLKAVDFHGIPFFAITHRPDLPRRQAFVIASAGFWAQHAGSEWILSRRPGIRREHAPVAKGVLAFNILTSGVYAGAAFARTGPPERDTRAMAVASRTDERFIGALVLAPAVLDAWRYYDPDREWLKWTSRAAKVGTVLLVLR
jgi:hypothetical protein